MMWWKKRQRNFQWWDVPEGWTLILRRGYSITTLHPMRKALYDEGFRVLDQMEQVLKRKGDF